MKDGAEGGRGREEERKRGRGEEGKRGVVGGKEEKTGMRMLNKILSSLSSK